VDVVAIHALPAKVRQERRVDVQNPMGEILRNADQLQKPRHADEIGVRRSAHVEDGVAECFARWKRFALDNLKRQPRFAGALNAGQTVPAADHLNDAGQQRSVLDAID
jgi:hypothetical protein